MKIRKIEIRNYRSIKNASIVLKDLSAFVGANNAGKTNVLEAIEFFFKGYRSGESAETVRHFGAEGDGEFYVQLEFEGLRDALGRMKNEGNRVSLQNCLGDTDRIVIRRNGNDSKRRMIIVGDKEVQNPMGVDSTFSEILPDFEYVQSHLTHSDVTKFGKSTAMGEILSKIILDSLSTTEEYLKVKKEYDDFIESVVSKRVQELQNRIQENIKQQIPGIKQVKLNIPPASLEESLKKYFITIDDGVENNIDEKGDGVQRAVMLSVIQAYHALKSSVNNTPVLFVIDEAELSLHPYTQRQLKSVLRKIVENGDQVIMTTHSAVLLSSMLDDEGVFKVEKNNNRSVITSVSIKGRKTLLFNVLGYNPYDMMMPENVLLVEGKTEVTFLNNIIGRFYSDRPYIKILPVNGDVERTKYIVKYMEEMFKNTVSGYYSDRLVVLMDAPSDETREKQEGFKKDYLREGGRNRIFVLDKPDIEQCYPKELALTRDKLPKDKVKYAGRVSNEITQEQFETQMKTVFDALKCCWTLCVNDKDAAID